MSGQTDAWMPFYVGDYLGDTQRLTTEQHGAYLLLILDYWRNGPPPDDDAVLRQIARLDDKAWKRHRGAMLRLFRVEQGEWRHKRIDAELEAARANADRRSSKARAAAEARWGNAQPDPDGPPQSARRNARGNAASNAPSKAQADAHAMPQAMLGECPPPSPKKKNPPTPQTETRGLNPTVVAVMEAAGFVHPPGDFAMIDQWLRAGADLDRDIIPTIRNTVAGVRARGGRMPFVLKFFDAAIREKLAADQAEIDRLQRITSRMRRDEEEQRRADAERDAEEARWAQQQAGAR